MYLRTLKALKLLGDLINGLNKTNNSRQKHFLAWTCFSEAGPTASLKFNSLCFSSLGLLKDFAKSYSSSARPCSNDMEFGVLSARQIDPVHVEPRVSLRILWLNPQDFLRGIIFTWLLSAKMPGLGFQTSCKQRLQRCIGVQTLFGLHQENAFWYTSSIHWNSTHIPNLVKSFDAFKDWFLG